MPQRLSAGYVAVAYAFERLPTRAARVRGGGARAGRARGARGGMVGGVGGVAAARVGAGGRARVEVEKLAGPATASPPEKQLKYLSVFSENRGHCLRPAHENSCINLVLTDPFHKRPSFYLHPFHKRPLEAKAIPPVPFAYLREEEVALNATARRGHRLTLTTFSPLSLHSTVREPLGLLTYWSVELHRQE